MIELADTTATIQKQFTKIMLTLLAEMGGSKLSQYCQQERNVVGESTTFYRMAASGTLDEINAYLADESGQNSGGDTSNFEVSPFFKYAQEILSELQLKKTNLDLKSSFMKSFIRALERQEDATIITVIEAEVTAARIVAVGDATKSLSDPDQFKLLAQYCRYAVGEMETNDDHGSVNVALVLSKKDYAALAGAEWFINGDYLKVSPEGMATIAGCELVVCSSAADGSNYILPANVIGFASFAGGDMARITYLDGKDKWQVVARKSMSAGVSPDESPSITKFLSNGKFANN